MESPITQDLRNYAILGKRRMLKGHQDAYAHLFNHLNEVKLKVTQSCLTLCAPMDCIHGILQARILEWVAFPFSRGSSQPSDQTQVSHIAGEFFPS